MLIPFPSLLHESSSQTSIRNNQYLARKRRRIFGSEQGLKSTHVNRVYACFDAVGYFNFCQQSL